MLHALVQLPPTSVTAAAEERSTVCATEHSLALPVYIMRHAMLMLTVISTGVCVCVSGASMRCKPMSVVCDTRIATAQLCSRF
jgi:hypothetical protein